MEAHPETLTRILRPGFESILGKEIAAVQGERLGTLAGLRGDFEGVDIDPQRDRLECDQLAVEADVLGAEGLPGEVDRLAQVAGCGLRIQRRPQRVHQLLAVKTPAGCQGQQLDQGSSAVPTPRLIRDRSAIQPDVEPAKDRDPDVVGHPAATSTGILAHAGVREQPGNGSGTGNP